MATSTSRSDRSAISDPTHIDQFSIVLVNDGTGHYPERIELPHPAFYDGYTSVQALTHFDVNGDGFQDLLLVARPERRHAART